MRAAAVRAQDARAVELDRHAGILAARKSRVAAAAAALNPY
jgi:hypothetical protein